MPASTELFQKYPNPVFIETGSCHGTGIQQALDAGFTEIYSIELSSIFYEECLNILLYLRMGRDLKIF